MSEQTEKRPMRIVSLVVLAFVAGMVARGVFGSPSPSMNEPLHAPNESSASKPTPHGPRANRDGIPTGFARSERGAVAAAASYVLTGQVLVGLPPTRIDPAVRAFAASASADRQVADAEQRLQSLRKVLAEGTGPTHYHQAVVATRADAYSGDRARVAVWSVGVLSRADVASPQAGWTISTFELVWERDDWKVWNETITAGPAPMLNTGATAASSDELEVALRGFEQWTVEQ